MDLPVNDGHLHQFQTQNDAGPRAIRSAMIQKREAVKRLEDEIAQLVENKKGLEEDLVRLGVALDHSLLPNEVLSHIFVTLLALGHGTVRFPIPKKTPLHNLWYRMYAHAGEGWRFVHPRYGVTRMFF